MLSFRVQVADLERPSWSWEQGAWRWRQSWLRPVAHPALESQRLQTDEFGAVLVVRERRRADPPIPDRAEQIAIERDTWGGDYVIIEASPCGLGLRVGPFGTMPLYVTATGGELAGSWHLPDLGDLLSVDRLNPRAMARALSRHHRYSTDTLFANVHQVTERATVAMGATGCTVTYPPAAEHVLQARELRDDVDPVDAFDLLHTQLVERLPDLCGGVGAEISGGADSANVALSLSKTDRMGLRSFGLVMPGNLGTEQQLRRKAITSAFGYADTKIPSTDHAPFVPTGSRARGVMHDPASSYYVEAFDALATEAAAVGVELICTGMAGDEISGLHPHERRHAQAAGAGDNDLPCWLGPTARDAMAEIETDVAPVPMLPVTALMALALHNPSYMRAGIWPVAPFAHPALVRFFEQLPYEWRQNKNLLRTRLRRAGLADHVAHPARSEEFTDVTEIGLRRTGLDLLHTMLHESILIDAGYLDPDQLKGAIHRAERSDRVPSELCDPAGLEIGLRSITVQGDPLP